jgi:hypothetical protein
MKIKAEGSYPVMEVIPANVSVSIRIGPSSNYTRHFKFEIEVDLDEDSESIKSKVLKLVDEDHKKLRKYEVPGVATFIYRF